MASSKSDLSGGLRATAAVNRQQLSHISTHFFPFHISSIFSNVETSTPSTGASMLGQLLAAEVSATANLLQARCLHLGGPAVCTGEGLCAAAGGDTTSSSSVFFTRERLSTASGSGRPLWVSAAGMLRAQGASIWMGRGRDAAGGPLRRNEI